MAKRIYDALTLTLHRAFPNSQIYGHEVKQGFQGGDFIVLLSALDSRALPGRLRRHTAVFSLAYFPKAEREDCFFVAERICRLLEMLPLPSGVLLRGRPSDCKIKDGIVRLDMSYSYFTSLAEAAEPMEILTTTGGIEK